MRLVQRVGYWIRLMKVRRIRRHRPEQIAPMMLSRMLADMGLNERGQRRAMEAAD